MFIAALFVAKIWKEPKCPSADELIKKSDKHTHKKRNTTRPKKNQILLFQYMHGLGEYYVKWNKSKTKYYVIPLTCDNWNIQ